MKFDLLTFSTDTFVSTNKKIKFSKMVNRGSNIIDFGILLHNLKNGQLVEMSIFEYSTIYILNGHYKFDLFYSIYNNKSEMFKKMFMRNPDIINKINNNLINPKFIAFIPNQTLYPEIWDKLVKKQEQIENKKNEIHTTDIYTCPHCKQKKCVSHIIQTRASDEALTTIIECLNCGTIVRV